MIVPCKDCVDRTLGCHSKCDKYAQYKAELCKLKEVESVDSQIKAYTIEATKTSILISSRRR